MENKKHKQEGLSEQVHGEFESSTANDFNTVREEIPVKKDKENDLNEPLNALPPDEDSVKNEESTADEAPKMDAKEKNTD